MARRNNALNINMKRDKAVRKVVRMYWILGIIIVLSMIFNMVIQSIVYIRTVSELGKTIQIVQAIMGVQNSFNDVNEDMLLLIAARDTPENKTVEEEMSAKIASDFEALDRYRNTYNALNADSSETVQKRFSAASNEIDKYRRKIDEVNERLGTLTHEEGMSIYRQELEPSQTASGQMLKAVIELGEKESVEKAAIAQQIRNASQIVLIAVLIGIIILIVAIGRSQVNSVIEIRRKEQELEEAGNRLTKSRKKLVDSAMTNILTGLKNRYALDESLSKQLGSTQFNIAVFDIDNFRMFNDAYGYEFGDEYLSTVAEMLKNEYADYAEIFNITGNEFCMIFHDHISDIQSQQLAEQIRQAIGQPMMIANIPVQATVSSSLYHSLPSDNLDVNTLLMKMDSALHAAKRDGGNRLYQIQ